MDILTHTLSGLAIGTVVASFSKHGFVDKTKIILFSGLAAATPDADVISLWSGFDNSIGRYFSLPNSGADIYSAKLWYSHRAALHSVLAGVILGLLLAIFIGVFSYFALAKWRHSSLLNSITGQKLLLIGFISGFIIHPLEDMPTPASRWGGVNFWWPSKVYTGGTGDIWWWNNYDIFLIVVAVVLINLLVLLIGRHAKLLTTALFAIGLTLVVVQIKTRPYDFAYSGYTSKYAEFETKSKAVQKAILGEQVFGLMERFDNRLKIYF